MRRFSELVRRLSDGGLYLLVFALLSSGLGEAKGQTNGGGFPSFDFTNPADAAAWVPTHDLAPFSLTATGVLARITGADPYTTGPARDYPPGVALWLRLKLFSSAGGSCQIFYFSNSATEANSVRFTVPTAQWTEGRVSVPALGPGYRLRIDPPGTTGTATLAFLRSEARSLLPDFDFTTVPDATSWTPLHDIASLTPATNGLAIAINGSDPYLSGPARDYPGNRLLWLHVRLKSDQAGTAQVFYYRDAPTEANSVRFFVPGGGWYDAVVPMPALGNGWYLRFDPPGTAGGCVLQRLWFEERVIYTSPAWPKPTPPTIAVNAFQLQSGELQLAHNRDAFGAFEVRVSGQRMAIGNPQALVGYVSGAAPRWLSLASSASNTVTSQVLTNGFALTCVAADADGARWQIQQAFTSNTTSAIAVETRITVNRDREVVYLPAFTLLPGVGEFGTNKSQGLLAGLEYLENEPSSSELDLYAPGSHRLTPDFKKVTFPLMAIAAAGRCLGLMWETQPDICPVFDSPDRQFVSGGHLMGLLAPGSDGLIREQGSLLPYQTLRLSSNTEFVVRATILGATGNTVVPAVQQFVALRGLPPLPAATPTASNYFNLAANSWLHSDVRTNNLFRHAVWPGFNPQPAADAAVWMRWLAEKVGDTTLAAQLTNAAAAALAQVPGSQFYNSYQIGHVHPPLPALVFGAVSANAGQARAAAQNLLYRFQPDGRVFYVPPSGGPDLGSTHYAPDANGLTAEVVLGLLENALFAGDRPLTKAGLEHLRQMAKFRDTVPRGAQTWEVPLHTPDILACAHLVRCYLYAYQLTGEADLLEQARYWAWTGVPFVYLEQPVPGEIGRYATIPVFGATQWVGSWLGIPVQWCGLVYGEALYQLAQADPTGPWKQIADGIAASGVQQSWPLTDTSRQGLLPDSYLLQAQQRDGPPINPATVESQAVQLYSGTRPYQFRSFRAHGLVLHAPGAVGEVVETQDQIRFTLTNWAGDATFTLVNGFIQTPGLRINGVATPISPEHQYLPGAGQLILRLRGTNQVELLYPALPTLEVRPAATNGAADISWPGANSNFVLQVTPDLAYPVGWSASTAPVRFENGRFVASEPITNARRFFRLRSVP